MFEPLMAYGWQGCVLAIWFALAVGSFLNVVIYRLPIMLNKEWTAQAQAILEQPSPESVEEPFNLMVPRSRCPSCGQLISAWQNIPVISWLALRGRCANCKTRIPARYPLVELLTALATLLCVTCSN